MPKRAGIAAPPGKLFRRAWHREEPGVPPRAKSPGAAPMNPNDDFPRWATRHAPAAVNRAKARGDPANLRAPKPGAKTGKRIPHYAPPAETPRRKREKPAASPRPGARCADPPRAIP